jgi:hypothetical protein
MRVWGYSKGGAVRGKESYFRRFQVTNVERGKPLVGGSWEEIFHSSCHLRELVSKAVADIVPWTWATNLRKDLRDDGVPQPGSSLGATGDARERWMLYMPKYAAPDISNGPEAPAIDVQLCNACRHALGAATPHMPWHRLPFRGA